jgi:hypothetical protein
MAFSLLKRVHIATKGDYLGGNKVKIVLDDEKMTDISTTYSPKLHTAPTVLGHKQSSGAPSWGWVESIEKVGDDLFADLKVADELKGWLKLQLYRKRSASFYLPDATHNPTPGKCHLRHLALLGAEPPVIKGLEDIANLSEQNFEKFGFGLVNLSEHTNEVFEVVTEESVNEINSMIAAATEESAALAEAVNLAEELAEAAAAAAEAEAVNKEAAEAAEAEIEEVEEVEEVVDLAEPKDAAKAISKGDNSKYINDNIGKWLRFLLSDGPKGYKDEISKFSPEPAKSNNWLLNEAGTQFKGMFMDESYEPMKILDFTLTQKGETWSRSFGLNKDSVEAETADLSEAEDSTAKELRDLRAKYASLQREIREKDVANLSESYYADGVLMEGQFAKESFIALVSSLEYEQQTVELSEGEHSTPFDLFTKFVDSLPRQIHYDTEIAPAVAKQQETGYINLSEFSESSPPGTMNDQDAYATHLRALAYCKEHDLSPLNTGHYLDAVKATMA